MLYHCNDIIFESSSLARLVFKDHQLLLLSHLFLFTNGCLDEGKYKDISASGQDLLKDRCVF